METSDVRQHVWEFMQQHSTLTDRGEACADAQNLVFQSLAALLQPGETPLAYADHIDCRTPDTDALAYHHEPGSASTDAYAYPHGEATKQTDAFLYDHGPETRETNALLYAGQDNPASDVLGYAQAPQSPDNDAMISEAEGLTPVAADALLLTDRRLARVIMQGQGVIVVEVPAGSVAGTRLLVEPGRHEQARTVRSGAAPVRLTVQLPPALVQNGETEWWSWEIRPGLDPSATCAAWRAGCP